MVWPVSIRRDVEGQRTSKLLMFADGRAFGRGGSNKNRDAMVVGQSR